MKMFTCHEHVFSKVYFHVFSIKTICNYYNLFSQCHNSNYRLNSIHMKNKNNEANLQALITPTITNHWQYRQLLFQRLE